jgi:hypothetical protein
MVIHCDMGAQEQHHKHQARQNSGTQGAYPLQHHCGGLKIHAQRPNEQTASLHVKYCSLTPDCINATTVRKCPKGLS